MQYMPSTWNQFSKEILGYVAPFTEINEEYVSTNKIQKWLNQGLTEEQIFLRWNAGGATQCSRGVNRQGVKFDSCEYVRKAVAFYNS